jgi:Ca-activated chloride channel family protein
MSARTAISMVGVSVLAGLVGLVGLVAARPNPGVVKGRVTNVAGNPLPGVAITLLGSGKATEISDKSGAYAFSNVPPGSFQVRFAHSEYATVVQPVTVRAGAIATVDARLMAPGAPPAPSAAPGAAPPAIGALEQFSAFDMKATRTAQLGAPGAMLMEEELPVGTFNTEAYSSEDENPFRRVSVDPLSTFSIDVDTASYANVRRFLNQGRLPIPGAVRIEELVNYFRFDYSQPQGDVPFSITTELAACPWNPKHRLALIGLQGRALTDTDDKPRNLVFLLDVSGSMMTSNKLPLVQSAMLLLVDTLTPRDRVAMVVYAGASGLVLPSTSGGRKAVIQRAISELQAGGSTNGADGIRLAYQVARDNFLRDGVNRVILATDGDFNVGVTSQDELTRLIERERESGVFLSVLGVGEGNLKDSTMEMLADKGNGNYSYLDSIQEGRRVLIAEAGATLVTVAKDVKLQIEFNPHFVGAYRLIGYENRLLRKEDFNDDRKDAGEVGAGHTVTALYEIVPAGEAVPGGVDPLKYQQASAPTPPSATAANTTELINIKVRYKAPDGDTSRLLEFPVANPAPRMTANLGFASTVAEFGLLLRNSAYKGAASWDQVVERARQHRCEDPDGYRAEFIRLVNVAAALGGRRGTSEPDLRR